MAGDFFTDGQLWWLGEDNAEGEPYWKWAYRGGTSFTTILNPETNIWRFSVGGPGSSWPALPAFREIREIEKNLIEVVLEDETGTLPVGHVVQTRDIIRNQVGSFFVKCKNLTLSHMRVMFMHGLGLLTQFCDGVHYEYVNCMPKEGRTIASTADFFQFSGCRGEVLIEHCRASGAHDDFINVHGTYLRVIEADYPSKTVLVRFMHGQSWGFEAFFAGDRILFTARKTLGPIAENTVASVTRLNDTDIRLVLTDDLPEMTVGEDAVENITWRPTLTVRNNFFGTSSGHGILANAAGTVLIEDNVFEHNAYGVLRCALDCSLWYESGRPDHIILRHNRFDHCCSHPSGRIVSHTQICPPVHDPSFTGWVYPAVTFEENEFINPPSDTGYHLQIARVGSVILRDNIFDKPYTVAQEYVGSLTAINTFTVKDS